MSNYPQPATEIDTDQSGRHPVSIGHLVMGVAFLGLVVIWLLFEADVVLTDSLRWFLPIPWLAAGVAGLLAVALTGRRSRSEIDAAPVHHEPEPQWSGSLWDEPDATRVEDTDDRPL